MVMPNKSGGDSNPVAGLLMSILGQFVPQVKDTPEYRKAKVAALRAAGQSQMDAADEATKCGCDGCVAAAVSRTAAAAGLLAAADFLESGDREKAVKFLRDLAALYPNPTPPTSG